MKLFTKAALWITICCVWLQVVLTTTASEPGGTTVKISGFGAKPDGSDTTPAVIAALAECRAINAAKLIFSPGRYDFWPDQASEHYCFISNNDEGLKRIAFALDGMENLEIDGGGAEFVFHGWITPFLLDHATNIMLKNFSIDWKRTFHSEAEVLGTNIDGLTIKFSDAFPHEVRNGILVFTDGEKSQEQQTTVKGSELVYPYGSLLEFDAQKNETAYMAQDYWVKNGLMAQDLGKNQVRIFLPKLTAKPGNVLVFGPSHRDCSAIVASDSENINLERINVFHCGGMGFIAQRSRDIHMDHVQVMPPPNSGRMVSVTADATHFVNCSGRLLIENCLFENQLDDASNIHGIYAQVVQRAGSNEILVRLKHPQQFGFDFIVPDETLEFVDAPSMITYHQATVKSVDRLNKEFTRVTFKTSLPKELKPGDVVASIDAYPEVTVRNCTIGKNRARGLLLGSRAKIVIENNHFHTPGAALLFEGDARFWFEQSGVRNVLVRSNVFDNCNFGVWGNAVISVGSGIEKSHRLESRYNRNIVIEDNLFREFDTGRIVSAYSVDGLKIVHNQIKITTDYPSANQNAKLFDVTDSSHINIGENLAQNTGVKLN